MNSETKFIQSRVGLLYLAQQLSNVTRGCKLLGTSDLIGREPAKDKQIGPDREIGRHRNVGEYIKCNISFSP